MAQEAYLFKSDLALEIHESISKNESRIKGIEVSTQNSLKGIFVRKVSVLTENAALKMGRPKGDYITIEARDSDFDDIEYESCMSNQLACTLKLMLNKLISSQRLDNNYSHNILVIGLGNRKITSDSLGPEVVDKLLVTRHIMKEYGKYAFGNRDVNSVSAFAPGIIAQTGMHCIEMVKGVVKETKPDLIITVDALVARSTKRLGRTIQLTDTGVIPGSGVGKHKYAINYESMGIPVVSIGIPTVVDAATIVSDAINTNYEYARHLIEPQLLGMFVTPKDIDYKMKKMACMLADGLNIAFSKE